MGVMKCCVPNCLTKSNSGVKMHNFPRPPSRLTLWLNKINCKYLNSLNFNQLANKKVCANHFERKFYENDRLNALIAQPTLFTAAEISSGIPNGKRDKLYNVCKIPDCLKDHTYYNTVNLEDQQPTLHADSGKLSAGMTGVLQQIENTFNSVIKPPCNKRRPDSKDISPTDQNACDSVVKHNEPPSKNRRTDSYDTTPTDQGSSSNQEPIDPSITKAVNLNTESCMDPAIPTAKREKYSQDVDDNLCQEDNAVVPSDAEADSEGELFSWQQDGAVVPSDDEIEKEVGPDLWVGPGLACSPERARASPTCDDDVYRCDSCATHIQGFRYTCVQCADVDLCCACEARQAHAQHYVLRIPGPRPHREVSAMLTRVRRALLSDGLIQAPGGATGTVVEIKEETEDLIKVEAAQDSLANLYTSCESQPIQEGLDSDGTDGTVKSEMDSNSTDPLEGPIDYVEGSETLNAKEVSETSSLRVPTISTNIEIISKLQPVKYKALMKSREPLKRPGDLDDCGQNKKVKTIRTKKKYPEDTSTKTDDVSNKEFKTISVTSTNLRKPESSKSITRLTSSKPTNKNYKILKQSLPDTAKSIRLLLPENLTKKEVPSALGNTTNKKYKIILEKVPEAAINKRLLPQVSKHSKIEIVPGTCKHLKLNLSEASVQVEQPDTATSIDRLFPRTLDDDTNKQIQSKP